MSSIHMDKDSNNPWEVAVLWQRVGRAAHRLLLIAVAPCANHLDAGPLHRHRQRRHAPHDAPKVPLRANVAHDVVVAAGGDVPWKRLGAVGATRERARRVMARRANRRLAQIIDGRPDKVTHHERPCVRVLKLLHTPDRERLGRHDHARRYPRVVAIVGPLSMAGDSNVGLQSEGGSSGVL